MKVFFFLFLLEKGLIQSRHLNLCSLMSLIHMCWKVELGQRTRFIFKTKIVARFRPKTCWCFCDSLVLINLLRVSMRFAE